MSDFIFSSDAVGCEGFAEAIRSIYVHDPPLVQTYTGVWGAVAVSEHLYQGFQPYQTAKHICIVIGGPVLCFRKNTFLTGEDPTVGTVAILDRWLSGEMQWSEDLSGPFIVLIIDKQSGAVHCVTDLLMWLPVYRYHSGEGLTIASHVDALATVTGQLASFDEPSLVDFVLHGAVTFPFTAYKEIRQCQPGAIHSHRELGVPDGFRAPLVYWQPVEVCAYESLADAAKALRHGVRDYMERIVEGMTCVAQFISAGEDSRALAGLLPERLKNTGYIFLDSLNREGHIAHKAAAAYGLDLRVEYRSKTHYLDILPEASALIGLGHEYHHAHCLGLHKSCGLNHYPAVFGGFCSDTLFKGYAVLTKPFFKRIPFIRQVHRKGETRSKPLVAPLFSQQLLSIVNGRRARHLTEIAKLRPESAHEWFELWPATMIDAAPNLYANRRLFREYEPYVCNAAVKAAAAIPTSWKLNRRLFQSAFHPFLAKSKWIVHPQGHLPFFPFLFNEFARPLVVRIHRLMKRFGKGDVHEGPWGDLDAMVLDPLWGQMVESCVVNSGDLREFAPERIAMLFASSDLSLYKKLNLFQMLIQTSRHTSVSA